MARKKLIKTISWIVDLIVAVGIGGLFWTGTMTAVPVLSMLPIIVHQIVGGAVYVIATINVLKKLKVIK